MAVVDKFIVSLLVSPCYKPPTDVGTEGAKKFCSLPILHMNTPNINSANEKQSQPRRQAGAPKINRQVDERGQENHSSHSYRGLLTMTRGTLHYRPM